MSEGRRYTLRCSSVPPGPNTRLHYMERYKQCKLLANEIAWEARSLANAHGHGPFARAQVKCIINVKNAAHMLDTDNAYASVKSLVDALKGVLIVDDSPRHIDLVVCQQLGDRRGVILEVTELLGERNPVPSTRDG